MNKLNSHRISNLCFKNSLKSSLDLKKINSLKSSHQILQNRSYFDKPKEKSISKKIQTDSSLISTCNNEEKLNSNCFHHKNKKAKYCSETDYLCTKCALEFVRNGIFVQDLKKKKEGFMKSLNAEDTLNEISKILAEKKEEIFLFESIKSHKKLAMLHKLESQLINFGAEIETQIEKLLFFYKQFKEKVKSKGKKLLDKIFEKSNLDSLKENLKEIKYQIAKFGNCVNKEEIVKKLEFVTIPEFQNQNQNEFEFETFLQTSNDEFFSKLKQTFSQHSESPNFPSAKIQSYLVLDKKEVFPFENLEKEISKETPKRRHSPRAFSETQWKIYSEKSSKESTEKKSWIVAENNLYSSLNEDSALFSKFLSPKQT